jgi:F-type H+-transporting ATPase subunit a
MNLPTILAAGDLLNHVLPHELFEVAGLGITNQMTMTLLAAIVVLLLFTHTAARVRTRGSSVEAYNTKGRLAQTLEVMCIYIRENVARPNLKHLTDKYIYYIWSIFFFVLLINLLGMVPIGQMLAIGAWIVTGEAYGDWVTYFGHWGGNAHSNVNITGAMAIISFFVIVGAGIREQGLKYFGHFAPVPFKPAPMIPLALFLIVLEIMGLLIKCSVLAMRLFGTQLAGHLVMAALIGLIITFGEVSNATGYWVGVGVMIGATAMSLLELFIAVLQAFIFTFLTVLFISAGAVHEHEDHEHGEHGQAQGV